MMHEYLELKSLVVTIPPPLSRILSSYALLSTPLLRLKAIVQNFLITPYNKQW